MKATYIKPKTTVFAMELLNVISASLQVTEESYDGGFRSKDRGGDDFGSEDKELWGDIW